MRPKLINLRLRQWLLTLLGLGLLLVTVDATPNDPTPPRDINVVLRAHDRELLQLPHVVGVYVGLLADAKTPCLKVMMSRKDPATERALPKSLEGYPVSVEVTGEIRPVHGPFAHRDRGGRAILFANHRIVETR